MNEQDRPAAATDRDVPDAAENVLERHGPDMPARNENDAGNTARDTVIVRTSAVSIGVNLALAALKAVVGLTAGSIAVILDSVNNLSDALSSVITILGAKLSGKAPDKKHPLGYGRVEYLSATLVAAMVLYAGLTALYESVKKVFAPQMAEYSALSLMLIALAVVVKVFLGRYVRRQGEAADSASLRASGADALSDAILSAGVLGCAVLRRFTGVSLEAYLGALIAVFIIRAGYGMIRDTVSEILGQRVDPELSRKVKELVCREEGVEGAYDLVLNNYGPNRYYGSVNIEVPDYTTAVEIDRMSRHIRGRVYHQTGVTLTGIGVYPRNTRHEEAAQIREEITEYVRQRENVLNVYGFNIAPESGEIHFYVVFSFGTDGMKQLAQITAELEERYPEYRFRLAPHLDISD